MSARSFRHKFFGINGVRQQRPREARNARPGTRFCHHRNRTGEKNNDIIVTMTLPFVLPNFLQTNSPPKPKPAPSKNNL